MGVDYVDTDPDRRPAAHKNGPSVGDIPDPFRGASYGYESGPERWFLTVATVMPNVVAIREQRLVRYRFRGLPRKYVFDAWLQWSNGRRVAYAIRDSERNLHRDDTVEVVKAIRDQLGSDFADDYRLVTYASLCPAAVRNARAILKCGRALDFEGQDAVRAALPHLGGEVTLEEVAEATGLEERGFRAALALIQSGVLIPPPGQELRPDLPLLNRLGRAASSASNYDA